MSLTRFRFDCDGVVIEGEGVVQVTGVPAADIDLGGVVTAFLSNLDPAIVEQAALNRQGWDDHSLAESIFDVLKVIAAGRAP